MSGLLRLLEGRARGRVIEVRPDPGGNRIWSDRIHRDTDADINGKGNGNAMSN